MAKITDPLTITQDSSYLDRALNDQHSPAGGRSLGLLSPLVVPIVPLIGSAPYSRPGLHALNGAANTALVVDAVGPPAGKLWLVTHATISHSDATARNAKLIARWSYAGTTVDQILDSALGLANGNPFSSARGVILNEVMKLGFNFDTLAGGATGHLEYLAYEFDVGEVPEPPVP